ncbi:hypothetical protein KUTeg_010691 [Tegillarca granosa]|uniref:FAS1 domain-containing protein n=1 Tax=Tegillarca granosa TaxID=220873 RepID=A0ABQ9F559_TEGGR|nr:hypothetical protein KUTeg_010691 [Tegillarca granosa]
MTLSYYDPVLAMQKIDTTLTLFVPSDKAMSKIPSTYRDRLEREEETLYKVVYAHIIPGQAVFTEPTVHNHGFRDGYPAGSNTKDNRVIIRKPNLDHVYVNSLRVTAEITNGNLTCRNGVVHIIDKLLGYVFYSVREEISKYARQFDQIINRANPDIVKGLTEQSQTTVFVPTDEAFQNIANLPWIDLNTMNQNITNMILRLHMLYNRLIVDMSALTGGYESRQPLESQQNGAMLYVYNERNESWVQGGPRGLGGVKAKVVDPDVACTNGQVNYINAVLEKHMII